MKKKKREEPLTRWVWEQHRIRQTPLQFPWKQDTKELHLRSPRLSQTDNPYRHQRTILTPSHSYPQSTLRPPSSPTTWDSGRSSLSQWNAGRACTSGPRRALTPTRSQIQSSNAWSPTSLGCGSRTEGPRWTRGRACFRGGRRCAGAGMRRGGRGSWECGYPC